MEKHNSIVDSFIWIAHKQGQWRTLFLTAMQNEPKAEKDKSQKWEDLNSLILISQDEERREARELVCVINNNWLSIIIDLKEEERVGY